MEELAVNHYPAQVEPEGSKPLDSLAERLDPSIGEASTVMGAMLTELLRRTLRGGVARIGEGLDTYVNEKVDSTLADRTPAIEQAAAEVAENTARVAATEVVHEEVHALEKRTQETSQHLAAQIQETAQTAQRTTEEKARQLVEQIEQAEKRVGDHTHARITQHVDEIMERSRKGTSALKARIQSLEEQLLAERAAFHDAHKQLRKTVDGNLEEAQARLRAELAVLAEANQALKTRVIELEKPRGLRGLLARIFSRDKKKAEKAQ
jgi:chromosome segregation ATPase